MNIGDIVNYQENKRCKYKGIITEIVEDSNEDHGVVEVWLYSKEGYGCNNCEHFAYDYAKERLTIINNKDSVIGKLVETEYGLGLIVKKIEDSLIIFIYDQENDYTPYFENNNESSEDIEDIDFDFENIEEPSFHKDKRFNKKTHCIELTRKEIKIK